jgi:hypothetical protein
MNKKKYSRKGKSNVKWTQHEDQIIETYVSKYPQNIAYACELAAKELNGRTNGAAQARYYGYLVKQAEANGTPMLALGSRTGTRVIGKKNQAIPGRITKASEKMDIVTSVVDTLSRDEKKGLILYMMGAKTKP